MRSFSKVANSVMDPPRVEAALRTMTALETALGYRFADRSILQRALTHRSRAHEAKVGETGDTTSGSSSSGTRCSAFSSPIA
jgi:hypothetical protein